MRIPIHVRMFDQHPRLSGPLVLQYADLTAYPPDRRSATLCYGRPAPWINERAAALFDAANLAWMNDKPLGELELYLWELRQRVERLGRER